MTTTSHSSVGPSPQERPEVPKSPLKRKASKDLEEMETREKLEGMCVASGCYNMTVPNEERGLLYCSNECVVKYCRSVLLLYLALVHCTSVLLLYLALVHFTSVLLLYLALVPD